MRTLPVSLMCAVAICAASLSPGPAQAQTDRAATSVEHAVARTVAASMPRVGYPRSLSWSGFGVRGGRDVFWHLHDPEPYHRIPLADGVHQRRGWLSVGRRSGDVIVCGDDALIGRLSIEISDNWIGESDVIAELEALGVTATPIERTADSPLLALGYDVDDVNPNYLERIGSYPALRAWRLETAEREPVELSANYHCTPPGTRSATRCEMIWAVLYRPDEPRPTADPCLPPHRPTDS